MMPKNGADPIRRMSLADIDSVVMIDRKSFSMPWSEQFYRSELSDNPAANLYVIEHREGQHTQIVGYLGFWFIVDEAHISTFAVHPRYRRNGYGGQLLAYALSQTVVLGAEMVSLEVRASNRAALALYERFGFSITERKPGYYQDNGEDALFMMLTDLEPWRKSVREA